MAMTSEPTLALSTGLQQQPPADIDCYFNQLDQPYDDGDDKINNHGSSSSSDHVTDDVVMQTAVTSGGVESGEVESDSLATEKVREGVDEGPTENMEDGGANGVTAEDSGTTDADGFHVEHRYETECVSRSKEVRDLSDDCTELRLRETKEVTLEELKTKEIESRPATFEEMRALLGAQFDGEEEIEIGREVVVEEYTRVESQREEMVAGKVIANTINITEEHKTEEMHDSPKHGDQPQSLEPDADDTVSPAILPVVEQTTSTIAATPAKQNEPESPVTPEASSTAVKPPTVKTPESSQLSNESPSKTPTTSQKKSGRFSFFSRKKKSKMPSDSSSFDGNLDLDVSTADDKNQSSDGKKHKLQKRFSFGGKTGSLKPTTRKLEGEANKNSGFKFFTLKRNKPKECVKVTADTFNSPARSPDKEELTPATPELTEQQEVYAVEGGGQIVVKTTSQNTSKAPHSTPKNPASGGGVVEDASLIDYPVTSDGQHLVVVAIDFGTTFSGYAFSFVQDTESPVEDGRDPWLTVPLPGPVHMMRRWEGGDPGVINQKTPTTLLLTPSGQFHSLGFTARNFYHDLEPTEAQRWLYFEKFKMTLHNNTTLNRSTTIAATNGVTVPAVTVFSHALRHFSQQALREISEQSMTSISNEDVRWVITVPAIWSAAAKQLMRQAAYDAGISSQQFPEQLVIALEPEAASIYIRKLRMSQLVPQHAVNRRLLPSAELIINTQEPPSTSVELVADGLGPGTKYMVVDCGGGTVDITVHEMEQSSGRLKELYKATGGPHGSTGIDNEFERLLEELFTAEFMTSFKSKRPAGWVDLMIAFESRKRAADPNKNQPLNVSLPFSFIDFHKKHFGCQVENAIKKYGDKDVRWSAQGMLRLMPEAMERLYRPTLESIKNSINHVLNQANVEGIEYIFLVGGFAESAMLQSEIRKEFGQRVKIVIPQEASLAILKGAVCFGLDPTTVTVRRSRQTYGVGVSRRFIRGQHPESKLVCRDNENWCLDVFDTYVQAGGAVLVGGSVSRSYAPAERDQAASIIHVYCSDADQVHFVTDKDVRRCGTLRLEMADLPPSPPSQEKIKQPRVIQAKMTFGGTEIKVSAVDVATGQCVRCAVDFLSQ